ncbi:caspase family protein [Mucilaginibacter sp.]|uniref:caspase family protein n=1 Tax=Mucilaginibacter sp. TaxID=1882438 RepID=UPI0025FF0D9A|nr:caspase family protein [Mucilaginibacter sp.]
MRKLILVLLCFVWVGSAAQTGNIVIPAGHALKVEKVLLDKQGKYLYTVEDTKAIMWDAKTHEQLYTFPIGAEKITDISLSNDGTKLAVGCKSYLVCFSTVTGKKLFEGRQHYYGFSAKFSADDSEIYTNYDGVIAINVATQTERVIYKSNRATLENSVEVLDASHIVMYDELGWQAFNTATKTVDYEYKVDKNAFRHTYLPNIHAMAYNSVFDQVTFRDVYTGKVLGTLPIKRNEYTLIPSADNKQFIMDKGEFEGKTYTVYNGATFLPVNQLRQAQSIDAGYFMGASHTLISSHYSDVYIVNTTTGKTGANFKRQVADLGMDVFNSLEYDYKTGVLNLITDDTVYKSVNLVKLKPTRHKPLPINGDITTFSVTGDTLAAFNYHKAYIKNLVTGKLLLPPLKLVEEASTNQMKGFFFSKDNAQVYFTTFSIPRQLNTLNRINLKTGVITKVLSYRSLSGAVVHPDKALMAGIDGVAGEQHAKVWNITDGTVLFDKEIGKDRCDYIALSNDKKSVLLVHNNSTELYNLGTGNLLSKSVQYSSIGQFGIYKCTPDLSILFKCEYNGNVTAINLRGEVLYTIKAHTSSIRDALFTPDGSIMYTVSTDQTIKVWQPATGKMLGTIFLFNDGNDFVFLDQYGRFDGTDGGIKRMYYYRNRIKVNLDVVYEKFYTPNLYQRLVNGEQFPPIDMIINPQPSARISYAQVTRNLDVVDDKNPAYKNTTGVAEITVNASAENDKIDEIRLFHNGKIINLATRGLFVTDNTTGTDTKKYTLNLLPGVNNIRAVALNGQRTESEPDEITVTYNTGGQANVPAPVNKSGGIIDAVDRNATMHLVVVGINAYKNPKMSLNYALADATAFKDAAELDAKTIITSVKTYFVTDDKADKNGIIAAFTEVQKNAKPQDVFVFYYAGHGVISEKNKEFYLVPNDVTDLKNVDEALEQHGIPSKMLQHYAIDIAAQKQVFILDACQSAGAFATLLRNDGDQQKSLATVARSTGTHWTAASGSQQFANEFSQLGHGAFTYVLLKAMKGEAASNKMVTINGLKNFLQVQVPDLMKKYNGTPQYPSSYGLGNDFPVGVIK